MYCKHCGEKVGVGAAFCRHCGTALPHVNHEYKEYFWEKHRGKFIVSGSFAGAIVIVMFFTLSVGSVGSIDDGDFSDLVEELKDAQSDTRIPTPTGKEVVLENQEDSVAVSVVDILCQEGSDITGGTGTIITESGMILTNNHIIPQDSDGEPTVTNCLVTVPNPQTGKIDEMYLAEPAQIPGASEKYDLAFFTITEPYVDDNGRSYGSNTNTFTAFNGCENTEPTLGEPIRVYGYPAISGGGWYLTVTDGLISAIPNDETIVTSAKISHGNSGGLAIDANGCAIGIPTMVNGDDFQSLGILISMEDVHQFLDATDKYLENI